MIDSTTGENLVFLLGIPRSGTTLLSVMLNNHPAIRCPPEPWLMLALESIGRTSALDPSDAPVLFKAFHRFCHSDVAAEAARQFAASTYNHALMAAGKSIFIDKTPRYYLILPYLLKLFPAARFVVLWRNPLDAAASMKDAWNLDIPALLEARADHPACIDLIVGLRRLRQFALSADRHQCHAIRYEDLVREPQEVMEKLFDWLGVAPCDVQRFSLAETEFDASVCGDRKILATESPHDRSVGRWRHTFTESESDMIIRGVGPGLLSDLGYGDQPGARDVEAESQAAWLEQCIADRRDEYAATGTYADLAIHRRRLAEGLSQVDLPTVMKHAADRADWDRARYAETAAHLQKSLAHAARLEGQVAELQSHGRELESKLGNALATIASLQSRLNQTEVELARTATHLCDEKARTVELRVLLEDQTQSADTARRLHADAMAEKDHVIGILSGAMEDFYGRLRLLLSSRFLRLGWKLGFGDTPYWDDPANDHVLLAARAAAQPGTQAASGDGDTSEAAAHAPGLRLIPRGGHMDAALQHLVEKGFRPKVVLDIGAGKGYWTLNTAWRWPDAEFFMIDPLRESERHLKKICRDPRFHYLLTAVGDARAEVVMNITPDCDGSSLLEFPNAGKEHQRRVDVETIDHLLESARLKPPALVKLDVQGFEIKAMAGGQRLFDSAEVFIIEGNLFSFMPGCPRLHELIQYMAERHFYPFDFAGFLRRPFENDLGQVDVVFVREGSSLVASDRW